MAIKSSIEWTGTTWNPTTGCNKISTGCKICYAEVMSKRLKAMRQKKYTNEFKLTIHPDTLNIPYTWKKPTVAFVNSMSDLFHKDLPIDFIQKVFKTMNDNPQHTFQILTKRADILAKYDLAGKLNWTPNIWMGTSVENNKAKVIGRIDYLRSTKAHVKFLSLEPLLEALPNLNLTGIDWCITGGESGPGARPIEKSWVVDIKDQCKQAGVPFFFKQWGKKQFNPDPLDPTIDKNHPKHAKGGCILDGVVYREMP